MPVNTVSTPMTNHPRALIGQSSSPSIASVIGTVVINPSGIRHAMKSSVSTPVARTCFDVSR